MTPDTYIHLADADQTRDTGAALGKALFAARIDQALIIHLNGELGAGKTTLVSGLLNALGHAEVVRSPTYTLIEPYEFSRNEMNAPALQVFHMDLYRLIDPTQLDELGVRDMLLPETVLLIEWPERAGDRLPHADISINLAYLDEDLLGRKLQLAASSASAKQLLQHLQTKYISRP